MPAISTLQVVLEARTKPFEDSMKKAGGFVKGLKQSFGEESGLGLIAKGLAGAGAVAGITALSRAIQTAAKDIEALNEKWAIGQISVGQYRSEVLKLIPVFGDAFKAGQSITDLWTGEGQRKFENRTRRDLQEIISGLRSSLAGGDDPFAKIDEQFAERKKKINALKLHNEGEAVVNTGVAGQLSKRLRDLEFDREFAKQIEAANAEATKLADTMRGLVKTDTQSWVEEVDSAVSLLAGEFVELETVVARIRQLGAGDQRIEGLSKFAASLEQSTKTSKEIAIQQIDDINEAVNAGVLRTSTAARAASGLIKGLQGSSAIDVAGSALRGSQESAALISGNRAAEIQVDLQRQQLVRMENMLGLSRDIVDELRKFNAAKVIE